MGKTKLYGLSLGVVCLAALSLAYSFAKDSPADINYTVKELFAVHEPEIDQSIEHVLAVSKDTANNIFIFRKYLRRGWEQYRPERVKYQEYFIRHGEKTIPLFTIDSDKVGDGYIKKLIINSALQANGIYLISVKSKKHPADYYQYSPTSYKVTKLTGKTHNRLTHKTDKRIDFADGTAVFVTQHGSPSLKLRFPKNHPFHPDKELILYSEQQAQAEVLKISDTLTLGNKRYILGEGHASAEERSFIWLVDFNINQKKLNLQSVDYAFEKAGTLDSSFIHALPIRDYPEIQVSQIEMFPFKSMMFGGKKNYVFDRDLNLLWQEKAKFIEQPDPSISGLCDNQFAIFRKEMVDKVGNFVNIDLIKSKGDLTGNSVYKMLDIGILKNFKVLPLDNYSLVIFTNYGHVLPTARFSWDGYKIFLFEFTCPKGNVNSHDLDHIE